MGIDMYGFIEVKKVRGRKKKFVKKEWVGIRPLSDFDVGGDYDFMACLFGIRNHARFKPVVKEFRSIPFGVSDEVEWLDWRGEYTTYITYEEFKGIDWDEEAEGIADWIFSLDPDGRFPAGVGIQDQRQFVEWWRT